MGTDGIVYDTVARDLYSLGYYLAHYKYRFLRWAYLFFLAGFLLAGLHKAGFGLVAHGPMPVDLVRGALLGGSAVPPGGMAVGLGCTLALLLGGVWFFRQTERSAVDTL